MKRMGWVTQLKPEAVETYRKLHTEAWPNVLATITACNIRNYSIFLREPENLLFGVFEYHGINYDSDMARMKADPVTQDWWRLTDPCQQPLSTAGPNEIWASMTEVFHHD